MTGSDSTELATGSKFRLLHDRGVVLEDGGIDFVVGHLETGKNMAKVFFQTEDDLEPHFMSSDNLDRIGYVPDQTAINLPVAYLNNLALLGTLTPTTQITIDSATHRKVLLKDYLIAAGVEETVHHHQHIKHPKVNSHYPQGSVYMALSEIGRLLSSHEVEARKITDQVLKENGRMPMWEDLDRLLQENYPDRYDRSIEEQQAFE